MRLKHNLRTMQVITNNPFRILGVWSNALANEIVTNKGRMTAFIRVGRNVDFPLDLTHVLGAVERTADTITAADSQLTVPAERLLAAQFWFLNLTPDDTLAAQHLAAGRTDEALALWDGRDNISALQNSAILHLALCDTASATRAVARLYNDYADDFIAALHLNMPVTAEELVRNYTSAVTAQFPDADLSALLKGSANTNISDEAAKGSAAPLMAQLNTAIDTATQLRRQDAGQAFDAGKKLAQEAKTITERLKDILGEDDAQVISIADKAANEICECAVVFYNQSNSRFTALDSAELINAAEEVAIGTMAKERVRENSQTLIDILETLPPAAARDEYETFFAAFNDHDPDSMDLSELSAFITSQKILLGKLIGKAGKGHPTVIGCSSNLANFALNICIDRINNANGHNQNVLRNVISHAEGIFGSLASLSMDEATLQRFEENRTKLLNMSMQLNAAANPDTSSNDSEGGCLQQFFHYLAIAIAITLIRTCRHHDSSRIDTTPKPDIPTLSAPSPHQSICSASPVSPL